MSPGPRRHRLVGLVSLPVRISAVTLACRDIGRMSAFYRQFGWPEAPSSVPEHVVFQCANGVVLGLFSETVFEQQFGGVAEGFRGFSLSINCEDARVSSRLTNRSAISTTSQTWTKSRNNPAGDAASASVTPKATSGTLPSRTVPTSITAAASSTPDTANAVSRHDGPSYRSRVMVGDAAYGGRSGGLTDQVVALGDIRGPTGASAYAVAAEGGRH